MSKLLDDLVEAAMSEAYPEGDDGNNAHDFVSCNEAGFRRVFKQVLKSRRKIESPENSPASPVQQQKDVIAALGKLINAVHNADEMTLADVCSEAEGILQRTPIL